jgi:phenylalanyl-tRNA synthetase beta chain
MQVSYKWLCEVAGVNWTPEQIAEKLTLSGIACEGIEPTGKYLDRVVIGEVANLQPIVGADKIRLATVNIGSAKMDVVCGAPNVAVGQKVPVALEGAKLAGDLVIKKTKIRGIESAAMICSERELGLTENHSGILVLDPSAPVGTEFKSFAGYDDYILTFEITPNRGDAWSVAGIARDLCALAGTKLNLPAPSLKESSVQASKHLIVSIADSDACPRYSARIIRNVRIGESPVWLKRRLEASGVRSISNVVDITNYVMLERGQPLHAFDFDKFDSKEVVVRRAKDKEKFTTLDGKAHTLSTEVLLITNGTIPVAIGGIMGGQNSEVGAGTTNILLESAYFNPVTIRRGRKHLDKTTDASTRFERGTDPNGVITALDRASQLIAEICGGEVLSGAVDCYPKKIEPVIVPFRSCRCDDILGISLSDSRKKEILTGLQFDVLSEGASWQIRVPTFRPDVEREIDLIEEIARIHGFENIPDAVENIGPSYTPLHNDDLVLERLRAVITSSGFDEMMGHGLSHSRIANALHPTRPSVRILNPVASDLDIMRNSLLQTALGVVSHNFSHRNTSLRLFEIGKVYSPPDSAGNWNEEEHLCCLVSGESESSWRGKGRPLDFYDLSGLLESITNQFHIEPLELSMGESTAFDFGVSYTIIARGSAIGSIGKVSASALSLFDIKQDVFAAELDLAFLLSAKTRAITFVPLPVYPASDRDLAIVVSADIPASALVDAIKKTAGTMAESVHIFDLYTGKQIEKGKKSIAISINFRLADRSLSSEEVDTVQKRVIEELKNTFNAVIRDK